LSKYEIWHSLNLCSVECNSNSTYFSFYHKLHTPVGYPLFGATFGASFTLDVLFAYFRSDVLSITLLEHIHVLIQLVWLPTSFSVVFLRYIYFIFTQNDENLFLTNYAGCSWLPGVGCSIPSLQITGGGGRLVHFPPYFQQVNFNILLISILPSFSVIYFFIFTNLLQTAGDVMTIFFFCSMI
jgi:hypothetical protein